MGIYSRDNDLIYVIDVDFHIVYFPFKWMRHATLIP